MPAISTDGFLLLDKPAGVTSHDVVAVVRRALGGIRAGHTGTLDPFATGLLLVLTGKATRLAQYVLDEPKTYDAAIRFGVETDSDDLTGAPTATAPVPDEFRVQEAVAGLTGRLLQTPPSYSAKQVAGRRAYAMARGGEPVELAPVPIVVHAWESLGRDADVWRFRITCGAGTYVRALARDLGRLTGSAAHLTGLRRIRLGPFDVADATPLSDVGALRPRGAREALAHMPNQELTAAELTSVTHGRAVAATVEGSHAALVDVQGALVAVAARDADHWRPRVVITHE